MNGRIPADQIRHDNLVKLLAKHFSSLGYKGIRTDIPGSTETPSGIYLDENPDKKYVPDITCFKNDAANTLIIAEAETCDTLTSPHTKEQWTLFSAYAGKNKAEFHIITPKDCKEEAQKAAKEMNVVVHNFWWIEQ